MTGHERLEWELERMVALRHPELDLVGLRRRPRRCRASWTIEDLSLELSDGTSVRLVWKDLDREAAGSRARRVKPRRVADPRREPWVYEAVLSGIGEGPALWGSVSDDRAGIHWLFLEAVEGVPLLEVGDTEAWLAAAAWLGRFHALFHDAAPTSELLLRQEARLHQWWYRRALTFSGGPASGLLALHAPHRQAVARVLADTPTLLHGEFYPANILVEGSGATRRVVPVDWEMAAAGPPALDLAALASGAWTREERMGFVAAYREARLAGGAPCPSPETLLELVDAAGLLLAVQWLGWAGDVWRPPVELRNDWMGEAVRLAGRLSA